MRVTICASSSPSRPCHRNQRGQRFTAAQIPPPAVTGNHPSLHPVPYPAHSGRHSSHEANLYPFNMETSAADTLHHICFSACLFARAYSPSHMPGWFRCCSVDYAFTSFMFRVLLSIFGLFPKAYDTAIMGQCPSAHDLFKPVPSPCLIKIKDFFGFFGILVYFPVTGSRRLFSPDYQ